MPASPRPPGEVSRRTTGSRHGDRFHRVHDGSRRELWEPCAKPPDYAEGSSDLDTSTEQGAWRTTSSATLVVNHREMPVRPRVPITSRSHRVSLAIPRICLTGSPS